MLERVAHPWVAMRAHLCLSMENNQVCRRLGFLAVEQRHSNCPCGSGEIRLKLSGSLELQLHCLKNIPRVTIFRSLVD